MSFLTDFLYVEYYAHKDRTFATLQKNVIFCHFFKFHANTQKTDLSDSLYYSYFRAKETIFEFFSTISFYLYVNVATNNTIFHCVLG